MLHWRFKKFSILPAIKVIGDTSTEREPFLVLACLYFLKLAESFGGVGYKPNKYPKTENDVSISFNIVFKRREDVDSYMEYIHDHYSYNYDYDYDM